MMSEEMMDYINEYKKEYARIKVAEELIRLVQEGILTADVAARECDMTEDDFLTMMKEQQIGNK